MHDPLRVGSIERVGDFDRKQQNLPSLHGTPGDAVLQGYAVQKFHGDKSLLAMFADFVDGTNIGMIQSGCRTRLPAKAFERLRVSRQFIREEFEGDETAKLGVLSFIDHTHPATTELLDDVVVRDGLADHKTAIW